MLKVWGDVAVFGVKFVVGRPEISWRAYVGCHLVEVHFLCRAEGGSYSVPNFAVS